MNRRALAALGVSSLSVAFLASFGPFGCSSSTPSDRPNFDPSTGGSAGTGTSSGSGSSRGTGGTANLSTGSASGMADGGPKGCDEQVEPARLTPVNIVFIIDKSGSMGMQDVNGNGVVDDGLNEWDHSEQRWNPIRDALIAFFQKPGTEGLKASLTFFPNGGQPTGPETGVCKTAAYASPAEKLRSLDSADDAKKLADRLNATKPGGGTPTLPALTGAIQYAEKLMTDDPTSQSVVVLVTDGEPGVADKDPTTSEVMNQQCSCFRQTGCPEQQQQEIDLVADAAAEGAKKKVPTYVIGMGEAIQSNLDEIAASGGTEQAFMVSLDDPAKTREEFTAALGSVRSVQGPCKLQIPQPPPGESFDKTKVNVRYTSGSGVTQELYYAGPMAKTMGGTQTVCPNPGPPAPSNPWFWEYDNEETPAEIILCDSACNKTSADIDGKVTVVYGCVIGVK